MSAAILGNWSMFGVLAIAVLARAFEGFGRRAMAMGPVAGAGAAMFIVSSVAMNAWKLYPNEAQYLDAQLFLWRYGLFADATIYLSLYVWLFRGSARVFWPAIGAAVVLHLVAVSGDLASVGVKQIAEFAQIALIAVLCAACFWRVQKNDLIGILMWGTLALNEVFSAFWVANCQFLRFGIREAGSSCEQVYGLDITQATFIPAILFWAYLMFRWFQPKAR